eukprot:g48961.t1
MSMLVIMETTQFYVSSGVFYFFISLCSFTSIYLGVLQYWVHKYREDPIMYLASLRTGRVVLFACALSLMLIPIRGIQVTFPNFHHRVSSCYLYQWVGTIGFQLSFGMIAMRARRVLMVVRSAEAGKYYAPTEWKVFIWVGRLLAVDIVLMTLWNVWAPW